MPNNSEPEYAASSCRNLSQNTLTMYNTIYGIAITLWREVYCNVRKENNKFKITNYSKYIHPTYLLNSSYVTSVNENQEKCDQFLQYYANDEISVDARIDDLFEPSKKMKESKIRDTACFNNNQKITSVSKGDRDKRNYQKRPV